MHIGTEERGAEPHGALAKCTALGGSEGSFLQHIISVPIYEFSVCYVRFVTNQFAAVSFGGCVLQSVEILVTDTSSVYRHAVGNRYDIHALISV